MLLWMVGCMLDDDKDGLDFSSLEGGEFNIAKFKIIKINQNQNFTVIGVHIEYINGLINLKMI